MTEENKETQADHLDVIKIKSGREQEEEFKEIVKKNLEEKEKERARLENERDRVFYLHTSHISNFEYKGFNYQHVKRKIAVTHEPNDLFVKYRITEVGDLDEIVYFVNDKIKSLKDIDKKLSGRKILEIHVYFVKYNKTPLYLNILPKPDEKNPILSEFDLLSYKLDKNGEWEKASHYAYILNDLYQQAYEFNMFQCFDIEKKETQCDKSRLYGNNHNLCITCHPYGNFKFYKHKYDLKNAVTKFVFYRNRLLKNVIVESGEIDEVDVYYHKDDKHNRLPLVIAAHKKDKNKEYFVNQGGNYSWKLYTQFKNLATTNLFLEDTLKEKKEELMGTLCVLDIGDYFDDLDEIYRDFKDFKVYIEKYEHMGYRALKYSHKHSRFSISKLMHMEEEMQLPELPLYSVEAFYAFHHASGTYPFFLCAVHESKHDKIFVWYELKRPTGKRPESDSTHSGADEYEERAYEVSYFLSDDPTRFGDLKPLIHIIESQHYVLDLDLVENLATSHNYGGKKLTYMAGHNFDVWSRPLHPTHHSYVITPAFSNYFTIKTASIYGERVICEELRSAKELHLFEHSNLHHYKLCVLTSTYNYSDETEDLSYHWYEIRKSTNRSQGWAVVAHPKIEKTPDEFDNADDIDVLMNESVAFDDSVTNVCYVKYNNINLPENIVLDYGKKPTVIYNPRKMNWPPVRPDPRTRYFAKHNYTTVTYDADGTIRGTTRNLPGETGGLTPLVGGLIGSGAGVGIFTVTTGYVLYTNMGTITQTFMGLIH